MIKYNLFKTTNKSKDKTVIITHGIAEYSKSYILFKDALNESGFDVITYDLKGHGKSDSQRGTINSYVDALDDLDYLVNKAYKNTEKVFLYGHSLGGVITNLYTNLKRKTDGIIITASPIKKGLLLTLLGLLPKKLTNNIKIKTNFQDPNLTHDYEYKKDEFDLDYFYFRYVNEVLIKGINRLKKVKLNDELPVLYIYSKNDKMVNLKNGKILYAKTLSLSKSLLVYEKSRHNLHLDIEKKRLFSDVISWLDKY